MWLRFTLRQAQQLSSNRLECIWEPTVNPPSYKDYTEPLVLEHNSVLYIYFFSDGILSCQLWLGQAEVIRNLDNPRRCRFNPEERLMIQAELW